MEYICPSSATSWRRILCHLDRLLLLPQPLDFGAVRLDDWQWKKRASFTLARTFRRCNPFASGNRARGNCSAYTLLRRSGGLKMACCGSTRQTQPIATQTQPLTNDYEPIVSYTPPLPTFHQFVYVGSTALTAVGVVTGQRYRFTGRGSVVEVDSRDAPSMAGVPNLRRLKGD